MNRNAKIAKQLVRIAKELVEEDKKAGMFDKKAGMFNATFNRKANRIMASDDEFTKENFKKIWVPGELLPTFEEAMKDTYKTVGKFKAGFFSDEDDDKTAMEQGQVRMRTRIEYDGKEVFNDVSTMSVKGMAELINPLEEKYGDESQSYEEWQKQAQNDEVLAKAFEVQKKAFNEWIKEIAKKADDVFDAMNK